MKDFAEAYKAAHAKAREYTGAKRAGWAEPGKRTRENHAILIPRQEAVDTANNLATAIYAKEVYITWAMNLRGFMVQLATGEHDAVTCRECGGIFRAPQHRYLFLTKNPARYLELDHMALLPHAENFWYGSTVANEDAAAMYTMQGVAINSFWSMEPLLGPVDMSAAEGLPQWVILGAETGNRADKVTPRREWVDQITQFCAENEIPVFFKENLREHFNDLPASAFPWDNKAGAAEWAAHYMGRFERQV